jgi:hypothetical protein
MKKFKVMKGTKPVRLASTNGNVCIVGEEWTDVPDALIDEAFKSRCIPEEFYEEVKKEVAKPPVIPEGGNLGGKHDEARKATIVSALLRISEEKDGGKETTEGGNPLVTKQGKPTVEAVTEYSGLDDVTRREIEAALK